MMCTVHVDAAHRTVAHCQTVQFHIRGIPQHERESSGRVARGPSFTFTDGRGHGGAVDDRRLTWITHNLDGCARGSASAGEDPAGLRAFKPVGSTSHQNGIPRRRASIGMRKRREGVLKGPARRPVLVLPVRSYVKNSSAYAGFRGC